MMDCTICVAKTKALISFAVTAKLICIFVFAYAKSRFSHNAAQFIMTIIGNLEQFFSTVPLSFVGMNMFSFASKLFLLHSFFFLLLMYFGVD